MVRWSVQTSDVLGVLGVGLWVGGCLGGSLVEIKAGCSKREVWILCYFRDYEVCNFCVFMVKN